MSRHADKATTLPGLVFADTKTAIEALTLVAGDEGAVAYATDTEELGRFDGTDWLWYINIGAVTDEPTGFPNRNDSAFTFTDAARYFEIAPTGASFSYFIEGVEYVKTGADSINTTDVEGLHFIHYNGDTLTEWVNPGASDIDILIRERALICILYWDATNNDGIYVGEERHGLTMDGVTHAYLHYTQGLAYLNGLGLTGMVVDGNGSSNTHAQFGTDSGGVADEDIYETLNAVGSTTGLPVYWRSGANGDWRKTTVAGFSVLNTALGRLNWNEWTGATWQQSEVDNADLVLCHVWATTEVDYPMIAIMGQNEYDNRAAARAGAEVEITNLLLGSLPAPEMTPIATVIFQTRDIYGNSVKARILSTDTGDDYVDWRTSNVSRTGIPGAAYDIPDPLAFTLIPDTLTIATGAVTVTQNTHIIAAETGITDDLDTINGTIDRQLVAIQADTGDTITIKHGTGNITVLTGNDLPISGDDWVLLFAHDDKLTVVGDAGSSGVAAHASSHESGGADTVDHDSLVGFVANEHIDHTSIDLTAGAGLTGGGTIAANRTFNVGAGTGIAVNADTIETDDAAIDHDALLNYDANDHIDHTTVSITASTGLSGGGTIAANRNISVNESYDFAWTGDHTFTGTPDFQNGATFDRLAINTAVDFTYELDVNGQIFVSDYLVAMGGIHVGGNSDPGTDNLWVDGYGWVQSYLQVDDYVYAAGGVTVGSAADPGTAILYVQDYSQLIGGCHVGGTSDPGTDNLIVDGQGAFNGATIDPTYGITVSGAVYISDYGRFDGGVHVGGASDPGTDNLVVDADGRFGGGLYVGSTGTNPDADDIYYDGNLKSVKGGSTYDVYAFHPLTTPLTNASFNVTAYSDTSATKIENTSWSSTIPSNAKALLLEMAAKDSGSAAATGGERFEIGPTSTYTYAARCWVNGIANDRWAGQHCAVPCTDGDVWFAVYATGTLTLDTVLRCWGYWI